MRFGAWNPDSHTRLFDRRKFSWNRDAVHEGLCGDADCRVGGLEGVVLHFTVESRHQFAAKTELYTSIFAEKIRLGQNRISWRKVWLNPVWRFCRDYILRLGVLDGLAGWRIACEGMRYTYLKYSKMAEATGGYRSPNWRGLTVVASAVVLGGLALKSYAIDHRSMLTQVTHKHESAARSGNVQLASLDDNYEDGDAVFPVDDDGVA